MQKKSKFWWEIIGRILTALTALIAAITGLIKAYEQPSEPSGIKYKTRATYDYFVSVRTTPSTKSIEVSRLAKDTEVMCEKILDGETLWAGNKWAQCSTVKGFIYLDLLTRQ